MAMPQKPVVPATVSPSPTKPARRMKAGFTNHASVTEESSAHEENIFVGEAPQDIGRLGGKPVQRQMNRMFHVGGIEFISFANVDDDGFHG
jgi:hypothetical protein